MLALDQTGLFLDALRPPPGMEVDVAVGTTFTLDLAALLAVPVAASFAEQVDDQEPADLLETIRRYADRTVLFCQAGAISVPPAYRAAITFVERTVVEIGKPVGGIFHPKTWVVRFSGRGRQLHRVLVMSRNLTFDRAWDVLVRLDEGLADDTTMSSRPVASFVRDVAAAAVRPLEPAQRQLVDSLLESLARARLAVPEPFTEGEFVALRPRQRGTSNPFYERCDHALAVSPFLTTRAVSEYMGTASEWTGVVSRAAALDATASALRDVNNVLRIKDAVLDAQASVDHVFEADVDAATEAAQDEGPAMRGLHAKFYVQDVGETSTVWLGSPNLTDAAFSRNWESLVRLTGPKRLVGYDAVLTQQPEPGNLSWLVEPHPLPDTVVADSEEAPKPLEARAYELASCGVVVALARDHDLWSATLCISPWEVPGEVSVRARLLSQKDAVDVVDGTATWHALALHHVTPFVVLELRADGAIRRVLVRATLEGDDYEDRRGAVLAHAIRDREGFLRYLAALLGLTFAAGHAGTGDGVGAWFTGSGGDRVLEDLLATASRQPKRLASLDQTLRRLEQDAQFAEIVPAEFTALWRAVHAARKDAIR